MNKQIAGPLLVLGVAVLAILAARPIVTPADFGAHERGYTLGWHRKSDEQFWKDRKIKYQGAAYCKDCHAENYGRLAASAHKSINCENCHGPAIDHPSEPAKLEINRGKEWCLRCHFKLAYPTSGRERIRGFADPEAHAQGMDCVACHNPHSPKLS